MGDYGYNDDVNKILDEGRHLLKLSGRYLKLEAIDKLSVLLTVLVVAGFAFAFGMSAIFFICLGIVKKLTLVIGDEAQALFIVGGSLLVVIVIFVLLRKRLVTNPVIKALARELFAKKQQRGPQGNGQVPSAGMPSGME